MACIGLFEGGEGEARSLEALIHILLALISFDKTSINDVACRCILDSVTFVNRGFTFA